MSAHTDDLVTQTAAFLFWDTVGSTAMLADLGEDRTERLRRRLFASVREVVAANRGQVVKSTGDGMMVAFPAALADALTCAVGIQRVVAALRPHLDGAPLEVRVGVSAGDAVRSWDERDWYGAAVNTAARLCDAAGSGGILATAALCEMAGWPADGAVAMALKGFDRPIAVVNVPSLAESDGAPASTPPLLLHREGLGFVGRTAQLVALDTAIDRLSSDGAAHIKVVGPAGSGKSRLVREWVHHFDADRTVVLASSCRSVGVIDALGAALDWYAASLSDADLRLLASDDPAFAAVVPTATRRLGIRNTSPPSSADIERALTEALRTLASSSTIVVVLDKVDAEDWVRIDRMALFLDRSPVLFVSLMSSDLTNADFDIAVGPLDPVELSELVAGELPMADADVVAAVTDALTDVTAGVALQATEVLLALRSADVGQQPVDSIGQVVRSVANMTSPYRGLRRLRPEHHALFFGRDAVLASVLGAVQRSRAVLVSGASGSGKSSLLGAGVIPAVELGMTTRSSPWVTAAFTPGAQPMAALRRELEGLVPVDEPSSSDPALDDPLLVVVDQFEEIWTLCEDEDERSRFVGHLFALAAEPALRCRLLIGLRSDFLARALTVPELREVIERAHVPLAAPTEPDLRRMIEGPAEVTGYLIDEALVERLLADVRDEPGALPLMSHALYETWRRREGRQLTLDGYLEAGATSGAIAATAESVVGSFDGTGVDAARSLFGRLVTLGEGQPDTRRRVHVDELTETERAVAAAFVDARLLTASGDDLEVAHEALILNWPRLREWLEQDRDDLRVHRRLTDAATAWDLAGRDSGDLYRSSRLADARDLAARHRVRLNDLEDQFLSASEDADIAEQQRVRRGRRWTSIALGAVSTLLVLALLAGTMAAVQWRRANERQVEAAAQSEEAERQRSRAEERRIEAERAQDDAEVARERAELAALTSTATQLAETEPRAALALGVEAYRRGQDLPATRGLLAALAARSGEQRPVEPAEYVYDEDQQCYRSGGTNIDSSAGDWWGVSGSDVVVRSIDSDELTVYAGARPSECAAVYVLSEPDFRAMAYDDGLLWITDDIDDFGEPVEFDPDILRWFGYVDGPDPAALVMTLPENSGIGFVDVVEPDGTRTRLAPGRGPFTNGIVIPGTGQALVLTGPLDETAFGESTALLVELSSGDPVEEFSISTRADLVTASADGGTVAVGHRKGVTVIDVAERRVVAEIAEPAYESLALDRTGSRLAMLRPDDIVTYDLPSGNVLLSEPAQRDLSAIEYLSDGRLVRVDEQGNPSLPTPSSPLVMTRTELAQSPRATFNAREGTVTVVDPSLGRIEVFDVATGASRQVIEVVTTNGAPELIPAAGHVAGDTVLAVTLSMEVVRLEGGVETGRLRLTPPGVNSILRGGSLQDDVVLLGEVGDAVHAYIIDPVRFAVTQELLHLERPSAFPTTGGGYVSPRPGGGAAVVHDRGVVEFLDSDGEIESTVSFAGGLPDAAATHRSAGGDSVTFAAAGSLWTAETGSSQAREIGRVRAWSLAVSPDGELALTIDFDGVVQAWHLPSGTLLGPLYQGGSWTAGSPAFTEDGSSAYVQFSDHVVRLNTDADQWVVLACELIGRPFTTDEWRLHAPPGTEPGDACPVT